MKKMNNSLIDKSPAILCSLLAAILMLGACASGPRTTAIPDSEKDYVLGVGDVLRISVYGEADLTGEFKVEQDGTVSFPLINDVPAAGFTAKDVETSIADKLNPSYIVDPRVTIEVLNYRSVYVLGEVNQPGRFEFAPNMTILQAIATAGGYTYRANEQSAEVTRHVKGALKTFVVNQDTMLKPGDTVVIKRRWF